MSKTIAINGTRLDRVRMPVEPHCEGVITTLSYHMSQIRFSRDADALRLVLPAYLTVELYRTGVLPQDADTPVQISVSGRPIGRYIVSDVRYPMRSQSPFGEVTFKLARVPRGHAGATETRPRSKPAPAAGATYVTDIKHYLDESGELAAPPGVARKLASFLTLLIEAATGVPVAKEHNSSIRCRAHGCRGTIRTYVPPGREEISWNCPSCGHNGTIRNWEKTKWNQFQQVEDPH